MSQSDRESMDRQEQRDAQGRAPPTAAVVFETVRAVGEGELKRPLAGLGWSGLAAGLSMGFSFAAQALLHTYTPDAAWTPIIASFGYSLGFMFVILGRQQLFTENTLTPILHLLRKKDVATLSRTAQLWGVVLTANIIGAALFAVAIAHTDIFKPEVHAAFAELASHEYGEPFFTALFKAIFAGWLIALMVWLMPFAETARVGVIIIVTYVIGLAGFYHIIAGSVAALYAVMTGAHGVGEFVIEFFIPVLIGNVIGGVMLVAVINYGQVSATAGQRDEQE